MSRMSDEMALGVVMPSALLVLMFSTIGLVSVGEKIDKHTEKQRNERLGIVNMVESMKSIEGDLVLKASDGKEVKLSREKINEIIKNIGKGPTTEQASNVTPGK